MGVAVAVLKPQDCLKQTYSPKPLICPPSQPKNRRNPNSPSRANRAQPTRKGRRSPNRSNESSPKATVQKPASFLVNGNVKILKRGENLPETTPCPPVVEAASKGLVGLDLRETTPVPPAVPAASEGLSVADLTKTTPNPSIVTDLRKTTPNPPVVEGLLGAGTNSTQIRVRFAMGKRVDGFYAGSSSCIVSPPPSSLPLPAFFAKKSHAPAAVNNEATSALVKILRLDLL